MPAAKRSADDLQAEETVILRALVDFLTTHGRAAMLPKLARASSSGHGQANDFEEQLAAAVAEAVNSHREQQSVPVTQRWSTAASAVGWQLEALAKRRSFTAFGEYEPFVQLAAQYGVTVPPAPRQRRRPTASPLCRRR